MKILQAEGLSLQVKKFCEKFNQDCKYLPNDFLSCESICDLIVEAIISYYKENLMKLIKENGLDNNGEYSLYNIGQYVVKE